MDIFLQKIAKIIGMDTPQIKGVLENILCCNGNYIIDKREICFFLAATFYYCNASQANVRAARQLSLNVTEDSLLMSVCFFIASKSQFDTSKTFIKTFLYRTVKVFAETVADTKELRLAFFSIVRCI